MWNFVFASTDKLLTTLFRSELDILALGSGNQGLKKVDL